MATFDEIPKLDSLSQVSEPRTSKTVAPRVSTVVEENGIIPNKRCEMAFSWAILVRMRGTRPNSETD